MIHQLKAEVFWLYWCVRISVVIASGLMRREHAAGMSEACHLNRKITTNVEKHCKTGVITQTLPENTKKDSFGYQNERTSLEWELSHP